MKCLIKYPVQLKTELIKPIHKKEEIHFEKNYRGISLTSCLSKFINMMGFRLSMRTSNNIFVLKTLIDKQFLKNKKLYTCFINFSKAFDTIWRKGLIAKLNSFGIEGKMLNIIKDLYSGTNGLLLLENLCLIISEFDQESNKATHLAHSSSIFIWMSYVQIC